MQSANALECDSVDKGILGRIQRRRDDTKLKTLMCLYQMLWVQGWYPCLYPRTEFGARKSDSNYVKCHPVIAKVIQVAIPTST